MTKTKLQTKKFQSGPTEFTLKNFFNVYRWRYGNRELLVNDLEFDTSDLRHFEVTIHFYSLSINFLKILH